MKAIAAKKMMQIGRLAFRALEKRTSSNFDAISRSSPHGGVIRLNASVTIRATPCGPG
ncbi:MAG: hypothetical protein ABSC06_18540 [Rhodopila sp.]